MWGQKDEYASKKVNNSPLKPSNKNPERIRLNDSIQSIQSNVQKDLKNGSLLINKSRNLAQENYQKAKLEHLDQSVVKKKEEIRKQMKNLDREMKVKQEVLKKAKRQISIIRYASHEAVKELENKKKKDIAKQVHKWAKQKKEIQKKKFQQSEKKARKKQEKEEKMKKQEQDKQQFIKLQKRKEIEQRIKKIQQSKEQRQRRLHELPRSMSTHAAMPRYKVAEMNYRKLELQKEYELALALKKNKNKVAMDPEELKAHEKAYIERIKQRLNMKPTIQDNDSEAKVKSEFNLYLNRKDQKLKQQMQKVQRRQKFQQKLAKIPLNVDQKKKIERQMNIDKAMNPHKYNFLAQKALNDQQIFKEFKQFEVKTDTRKLGNDYLQQLKSSPRKRLRGSQSQSTVLRREDEIVSDRPNYKNYMAEVKVRRKKPENEVQQIKKAYKKNPELVKELLNRKSQNYEGEALRKIKELKVSKNYQDSLQKEHEIDEMFFRSLETKIATAELV